MKRKFPVLAKVMILGIGVSTIIAGTAVTLSYFNQKARSELTLIENIDNTLDEVDHIYVLSKNGSTYTQSLKDLRSYVENIYDSDTVRPTLKDYDGDFEKYSEYYTEKYPWLYPNAGGMIGFSQDMAKVKNAFFDCSTIVTNSRMSSGSISVFMGFPDSNNNIVMLVDSRADSTNQDSTSFYHLPGTYYRVKDTDTITEDKNGKFHGLLGGFHTRFAHIRDYSKDKVNGEYVATIYVQYDLEAINKESAAILQKELLILGVSSLALVAIYMIFAYLLFVRNINKLTRASTEITQKLDNNKHVDEIVSINIKSNDEMMILANSFIDMEKAIVNYVDIIKKEASEREAMNAELMVASKIQLDSLPPCLFDDEKTSLRAFIQSAKEVSGDFYDYFYLDDHRLAIVISDVSGKGIPASLFMMKGKELVKAGLKSYPSLTEAIRYVNSMLYKNNKELLFITSFIGIIDFNKNEIKYINAGQEKPYIISANKVIKLDGEANIVLGVEEDYQFVEESYVFNEGDCIFMFTDGLNESINDSEEEFGYQRIEQCLKEKADSPLENIIDYMYARHSEFVDGKEQFDDITMLLAKFKDDELHLHYDKKDYEIITDMTDKFNEYYGHLSEKIRSSTGIILDELINNYISYEKREDLLIDVHFKMTKQGLSIEIISNGMDYNPFDNHKEKYLEKFHSEIKEGGFGLSLVKDLSKSYSYKYFDNKTHIEILISD